MKRKDQESLSIPMKIIERFSTVLQEEHTSQAELHKALKLLNSKILKLIIKMMVLKNKKKLIVLLH